MAKAKAPILFEAALPTGQAFALTGEGDATLKLAVVVRIEGTKNP